ncbi:deoxyribodipyrimidine photo-lyase [filamentous cyanobacterium LEGE 11480]|uniref:Deoxyribodipyrimidine photo-lyase n=1 Tax=Romeriopsis navalis LEGE 11480 TaxID=2777977 RepID=A0A928Z400_9CYAN|nr:deoxyribodipyrimidine photo-lyase [Romeriopsis navalis]MBE9030527.1 deoxyribodipyrimidine photo-lyase [Romeriopsis navalis LEGE 11480]
MKRTIVWFRRDLRLCDHAPLARAVARGAVIPVFILDRALLHHPETGVARVAFMLDCLRSLDADLRSVGGRLIIRSGDPVAVLPELIRSTQADGIYSYIDYERIYGRVRDARLNQALDAAGMRVRWFEPTAATGALMPYPDYRQLWYREMSEALIPAPPTLEVPEDVVSDGIPTLAELGLLIDQKTIPTGGTQAARKLLQEFLTEKTDRYYWQLSIPSAEATSALSPYIKFGVISVRECFQVAQHQLKGAQDKRVQLSLKQFISRLRWGSGFAQRFRYLPQLELRSLYPICDESGWAFDEAMYAAWQNGETGFPIIDAAARCLQETGGWLSLNFRTRAIYASFLSNLLGIDWRYGALHFMRHLIDGDCPIDHYQWAMQAGVTHCIDKSWTRIYNPEQTAVDRCDPEGLFIQKWVPELAQLKPAELGLPQLAKGYPKPILNYKAARQTRVQQLEQQRQSFRRQRDIVPFLARMPESIVPFGADRFNSEIRWAETDQPAMFPPPLALDDLTLAQSQALRTWLVAHVNVNPRTKPPHSSSGKPPRAKRQPKPKPHPDGTQLNLLLED